MTALLSLGGSLGLAGVAFLLVMLGVLSKRLGAVLKMPPRHRWFYVAAGLVGVAWLAYVADVTLGIDPASAAGAGSAAAQWGRLLFYHLPLAVGLTLGLATAWHYWGWLLRQG